MTDLGVFGGGSDGDRSASTRKESEEKLDRLIETMKAEIAVEMKKAKQA